MGCAVCAAVKLSLFEHFHHFKRITSDCKPFASGGKLGICRKCGAIQKVVDEQWLREISVIYENYEIYSQSGGEEQAIFNQTSGAPSKRSAVLNKFIRDSNLVSKDKGKVLDYGCANGEFLSIFATHWPNWQLYGFDLNNKYEGQLRLIPNFIELYNENVPPAGQFDLIALVHTLEHLVTPIETLITLKKSLTNNGLIFIQVPHVEKSPFDILIADHLTHFTTATLSIALVQAGFKVKVLSADIISKEISVLASPLGEENMNQLNMNDRALTNISSICEMITNHCQFLEQMLIDAKSLDREGKFVIFGSSISATWLASYFKNVYCFADEDPNRIGKTHQGKSICSISQIPDDTPIYIPLSFSFAKTIASRLSNEGKKFILPPNIETMVVT